MKLWVIFICLRLFFDIQYLKKIQYSSCIFYSFKKISTRSHAIHAAPVAVNAFISCKKVLMVTDHEFDFSDVFPQCLNVFCWNFERDLHLYLKNSANCRPSEISYYANTFKELMTEESEEEFDKAWNSNKVSFTNDSVLKYFEQRLIPAFKEHSSIWKLREMGVPDPENGLTNNPPESMNTVFHSLQQWKQVSLDVMCVSLFHLSCYYQCEITRAHYLCGTWHLKEEFSYFQKDASLMPFLPKTIDPKEIFTQALLIPKIDPILCSSQMKN